MTWNRSIFAKTHDRHIRSSSTPAVVAVGVAMLLSLMVMSPVLATDDDVLVEPIEPGLAPAPKMRVLQLQVENNIRVEMAAVQIVVANRDRDIMQVFGHDQRERWRLNTESDLAVAYLDRTCQLTDPQREKLMLAGRADRQRFFDRLKTVAGYWNGSDKQSVEAREELADLQNRLLSGLLDSDSFFAKALGHVLTTDQLSKLEAHRTETNLALANKVLDGLTLTERLDQVQREALLQLITTTTPAPLDFGNTDELLKKRTEKSSLDELFPSQHLKLMKYQLARKSMERVRPLLRQLQWQEVRPQLIEYRRFEPELLALRLIAPSDDAFKRVPLPEESK